MKLSSLPAEILNLVKIEAAAQGKTIDFSADLELRDDSVMSWANTSQGYRFWEIIESADFSEFYSKYPKEDFKIYKITDFPIHIADLMKEFIAILPFEIDEKNEISWETTSEGLDFWRKASENDFAEFLKLVNNTITETTEKLVQEINNPQKQVIMQNVQNTSKNLPLVQQLQDLEATGKVRVIVRKEVRETHYKTRDLNAALEKQVVMNLIHTIPAMEVVTTFSEDENDNDGIAFTAGDSVEVSQPRVMIDILIIGLDNADTIQKKIDIAKGRLAELDRIDKIVSLRESDNLLDCLDGYFGEGNRIAIKEQSKNN